MGYELILRTKSNLINKLVHQSNKCRFGVIQNLVFKKERNDHTRNINSERGIVDVLRFMKITLWRIISPTQGSTSPYHAKSLSVHRTIEDY